MLVQQQQLNLIAYVQCFITLIKINNRQLIAIIDFDTIDNFIIKAFVKREEYSIEKKLEVYNLIIVDKNLLFDKNKKVNKKTKLLLIAIQQHHEKLIFNIVKIVIYNIVLKMF